MHETVASSHPCSVREPRDARPHERGVHAVVLLTAITMVVEIGVGYAAGSMALLADGWHMATHVAALGLATAAYTLARNFASHRAFGFGTGKIHALAGYTSAVALSLVALLMIAESIQRMTHPIHIDFATSLPVAVAGLAVNLVSVRLLHDPENEPTDDHDHDHNHKAALIHVMADALTSGLAIVALLAGHFAGWTWLDPLMGIIGGVVILKWGASLCRNAAFDLLDVEPSSSLEDGIRTVLEQIDDSRVSDLHVWSLGGGARSCVVSVISSIPRDPGYYHQQLARFELAHLTVEVQRCIEGHETEAQIPGASLTQPSQLHPA